MANEGYLSFVNPLSVSEWENARNNITVGSSLNWDVNNPALGLSSTGYSGGGPIDFGPRIDYGHSPERRIDRCEYCNVKALPDDRFCVGCGAPV